MAIIVNLDVMMAKITAMLRRTYDMGNQLPMLEHRGMMAKRKITLGDLADRIGITPANLSILKTGKAKAIRFSTLEAICKELDCQPVDILEFKEDET